MMSDTARDSALCLLIHLSKHPFQQVMRKKLSPGTLRTPTHLIPSSTITPPPRVSHNLLIQLSSPLRHRPTSTINNAASPRPLPCCLNSHILGLKLPARVRGRQRVPYAQRVVQLQAELGGVLVGVQREELLEGGQEEEGGPVCEGRVDQRFRGGVFGV